MEEKPKKTGFTKVCKYCRHVIVSQGKFWGFGSFLIKCANPECLKFNVIDITQESIMKVLKPLTVLIIIIISFSAFFNDIRAKNRLVCKDFIGRAIEDPEKVFATDQEYAQALYNSDRHKYYYLDGADADKLACNSILK